MLNFGWGVRGICYKAIEQHAGVKHADLRGEVEPQAHVYQIEIV